MKNNLLYVFALFLLATKLVSQTTTDTVFVYETIVVYDTIKVYDTLKVEYKKELNSNASEVFFKNNNSAQNAVLVLFNKNDTATISISNIILSETNKNLDTMKKEILTLAAAALLAQLTFAQESKTITATSEEKTPAFTMGVALLAYSGVQGIHLNAYKILNPKLGFGISTDIGRVFERGWTGGDKTGNIVRSNLNGIYTNFLATATYYLLGTATSKAGVYGKTGLGIVGYKTQQTEYSVGFSEVSSLQNTFLSFCAELSIGADVKLGKGKLFAEIVSLPTLMSQNELQIIYSGGSNPEHTYTYKRNETIINGAAMQLGVRLGYVIHF